ncbi:acetylcholine receptor subunit alpha-1-B [Aplysia californica]|uniref:Acetylcholine receptor subunit alpha-1-B n=1 Tax=Aplysia californica TaxID=6500 RepID=A0ABM0JHS3_APLCA|nr:acetylcholine receptor subunit alpha-1-B [Aplysia californica]
MRFLGVEKIILLSGFWIFAYSLKPGNGSNSNDQETETFSDASRLLDDVIKPYDSRIRPILNQSQPLSVTVLAELLNLHSLDEVTQTWTFSSIFRFKWRDQIKTWQPKKYGNITEILLDPQDLWSPRLSIPNSLTGTYMFAGDSSFVKLKHDGSTIWEPGCVLTVPCDLDLTYFPFDTQTCILKGISYDQAGVILHVPEDHIIGRALYSTNGEWDLIDITLTSRVLSRSGKNRLDLRVVFKRRPMFFVVNVLLPDILLSLLSLLVFILPEESGERASYSITVVLSLAVFMSILSKELPQNSDSMPIMCEYMLVMLSLSGLSVVVTVIQLYWSYAERRKWTTTNPQQQSCSAKRDSPKNGKNMSSEGNGNIFPYSCGKTVTRNIATSDTDMLFKRNQSESQSPSVQGSPSSSSTTSVVKDLDATLDTNNRLSKHAMTSWDKDHFSHTPFSHSMGTTEKLTNDVSTPAQICCCRMMMGHKADELREGHNADELSTKSLKRARKVNIILFFTFLSAFLLTTCFFMVGLLRNYNSEKDATYTIP